MSRIWIGQVLHQVVESLICFPRSISAAISQSKDRIRKTLTVSRDNYSIYSLSVPASRQRFFDSGTQFPRIDIPIMPAYEVRHAVALTNTQKDDLAEAITQAHSNKFTTMRNFVNVRFADVSKWETYVGGKRQKSNMIIGQVRSGPSRTRDDWTALCSEINNAWTRIVIEDKKNSSDPDLQLRAVFTMGEMLGGLEGGMVIPAAGHDMEWLERYWPEIKRRAAEGEWEMEQNVKDVEDRGLLELLSDGK